MTLNKIDHEYTNEIVCPYCGYKFNDSWQWNENNGDKIECGKCGEKFNLDVNFSVDHTTSKINCDDKKEKHEYEIDSYFIKKQNYEKSLWVPIEESLWQYKRIEICKKCDDQTFIPITKEEYEDPQRWKL